MAFAMPLFQDQYACGGDTETLEVRTRPRRQVSIVGRDDATEKRSPHMLDDRSKSAPLFSHAKLAAVRFKVEKEQRQQPTVSKKANAENGHPSTTVDTQRNYGAAKQSEASTAPPETATNEKPKRPPLERGRSILVLLKRLSSRDFGKESLATAVMATNPAEAVIEADEA